MDANGANGDDELPEVVSFVEHSNSMQFICFQGLGYDWLLKDSDVSKGVGYNKLSD